MSRALHGAVACALAALALALALAGGAEAQQQRRAPPQPELLRLGHGMPGAWFYPPGGGGRQRVLVYLHARNTNPREACRRWREVSPPFGWLLCPIGQVDRGGGRREWRNSVEFAHRETMAALQALHDRFPRRVRMHDNVIMGFSEGAYVGMNVGLLEPLTFPRWFIIGADDRYVDSEAQRIARAAATVQRVYLLTGEYDGIAPRTRAVGETLARAFGRRRVRVRIAEGMSHQLPPDMTRTARPVLSWVTQ